MREVPCPNCGKIVADIFDDPDDEIETDLPTLSRSIYDAVLGDNPEQAKVADVIDQALVELAEMAVAPDTERQLVCTGAMIVIEIFCAQFNIFPEKFRASPGDELELDTPRAGITRVRILERISGTFSYRAMPLDSDLEWIRVDAVEVLTARRVT